jgi:MFS family permease
VTDSGNREWRILAIVLAGSFMAVLDTTIVNVALPSVQQGAHASSDALEWIVPREQAGGALITAQRLGAAIGIAVVGTALFGGSGGSSGRSGGTVPFLLHNARTATLVNLCFVFAALLCAFGLPRTLDEGAGTGARAGERAAAAEPGSPARTPRR